MLEAEMLIRPEVQQKLTYMYRSHTANSLPNEVPQSFILDTNLTAQPDGKGKDDWNFKAEVLQVKTHVKDPKAKVKMLEGP